VEARPPALWAENRLTPYYLRPVRLTILGMQRLYQLLHISPCEQVRSDEFRQWRERRASTCPILEFSSGEIHGTSGYPIKTQTFGNDILLIVRHRSARHNPVRVMLTLATLLSIPQILIALHEHV